MEEVLVLWGWQIHFKDENVCSMVNPKDKKARPICIPQSPGPFGLSSDIVNYILFEAKIDSVQYPILLGKVQAIQQAAIKR